MPSTLLDNLVDAWYLNEQPGQLRRGAGGNTLTDFGTVARTSGKRGYAASFSGAQRLSRASTPGLSLATIGWWMWTWVKFAALPASNTFAGLISKQDDIVGREFTLALHNNGGSYQVIIFAVATDMSVVSPSVPITPDLTTWHLLESWKAGPTGAVSIAWDGGSPASAAQPLGTRSAGADFHLGTITHSIGFLNGALNMPGMRKQAPTPAERAEVWNAGAGNHHPFGPTTTGSYSATLDNAGGAAAVPGGRPLPLFLPPAFFDSATLYYPNGDDLSATDALGNSLAVWPEAVDQGNRHGRVWVETPAAGVPAAGSAPITLHYGDSARFATGDYDTLFAKRTVDANTVALYHLDTFAGSTTPEASAGTAMALVGTPTQQAADGGNFKVRVPRQVFASGKHLTFNGTSQYATVAGLLDAPPAAGCVHILAKLEADPTAGSRLYAKINAYSGATVTEGLECFYDSSGQIVARITAGGVAHDAIFETFGAPGYPHPPAGWAHIVVSWGSKLSLVVNASLHAENPHTGAWGNNSGGTPFTVGARLLATADSFAPVSVDDIEVRNTEPSRAQYVSWFGRGAIAQTFEHDRWTPVPGNPVVDNTAHTAGEPRLERKGTSDYLGVYGAGSSSVASLYPMSSTNGKDITFSETPIMGNGVGGWSGNAARGNIFNDAGTLYLYWTDAIGTTGGSIHFATSNDGGATWTYGGIVVAPDATHGGWANSSVVRVGNTYHWMIEYSLSGGAGYSVAYLRSSSPTGPLTLIDDVLCEATLRVGTGSFSVGRLLYIAGEFHFYPHISYTSNLPSGIHHFKSLDCQRWQHLGGGEPVREIDFGVLPRQDQAADCYVYAIPESGEVGLLHDVVDNHGGGGVAAVCLSTFPGTLADLSVEYPQLVLGSPVVPPAPPTPTFTSTPADPSPVGGDVDFAFTSAGATSFECRIDGGAYATCTSPQSYTGLAAGAHTFAVRALNTGGTSSPASYSWTVSAPPLAPGTAVLGAGVGLRRGGRP